MTTVYSGGMALSVQPGSRPTLYVHDVGSEPAERRRFLAAAVAEGAWSLHLRGHGRSAWVRGGVYDLPGFTADVVRVLQSCLPGGGIWLVGQGAGGLAAAAAAAAVPQLVRGVRLVPGAASPWSVPGALVTADDAASPDVVPRPNRHWLDGSGSIGAHRATGHGEDADDPALRLGPPQPIPWAMLVDLLAGLVCPWQSPGTWLDPLLSAGLRRPCSWREDALTYEPGQ